jgi:hypothetical protein
MWTRFAAAALSGLVLAGAGCPRAADVKPPATRSTTLPLPRDPDIAVQEELDAARRTGTLAAYDLFLARNGDHPLAEPARRERARIAARTGK